MFDTFASTLPSSVRTVEELKLARADFEAVVASKPSPAKFEELLLQYTNCIELLPECDPRSLGIDWLNSNTGTFAELTNRADPRDFLRRCFTNDFISHVLYNKELLLLIPATHRGEFILELLQNQSPWGYDWFGVVVVPGFNIGEYLVMRLINAHPDSAFFRDFTKPGKSASVLWGELNAQQFLLAIHAVVSNKPELMFEPDSADSPCFRQRVEARLKKERQSDDAAKRISVLLIAAAEKLTSLKEISYSIFKRLPVTDQHRLLRQVAREEIPCSILFLTELAVDKNHFQMWFMPFLNGAIRTVRPSQDSFGVEKYECTASIAEYLKLRKLIAAISKRNTEAGKPDYNTALLQDIDDVYRTTLEREGIYFGTLVESIYHRQKRSGGTEMCTRLIVRINVKRPLFTYEYVCSTSSLKPGDLVAFERWNTKRLYLDNRKSVSKAHFTVIERAPQPMSKSGPRR